MANEHLKMTPHDTSRATRDGEGLDSWWWEESGGIRIAISDPLPACGLSYLNIPWRSLRSALARKDK